MDNSHAKFDGDMNVMFKIRNEAYIKLKKKENVPINDGYKFYRWEFVIRPCIVQIKTKKENLYENKENIHTYDDEIDNKEAEVIENDTNLEEHTTESTKRIGHDSTIWYSLAFRWISEQEINGCICEKA